MASVARKPKLRPGSYALLVEIDAYIRRYNLCGDDLRNAASDVCDGAVVRSDLDELVSKRWLVVEGYPADANPDFALCGDLHRYWTVRLHQNAMKRCWPGRLSDKQATPH